MREPLVGECGIHPGNGMVNCPACAIEAMSAVTPFAKLPAPTPRELDSLFCDICQLLDGWKNADPQFWTEWDQSVRSRITAMRVRIAAK